jgi:hypothetical protein
MMGIHSKFLVHWTGKDIEEENYSEAEKSQLYVERLKDDLEKGLYTKKTSEAVIRNKTITNIIRLCFTEIRLSQAETHARRYGKLGIGFTREFIMNKGGRPVIYIPFIAKADGRLLEDSILNVYEKSKDYVEINKSSKWIMAHVKRMSNGKDEDSEDYEDYYEELEWRLVYHKKNSTHFTKDEAEDVRRLKFNASDIKVIIFRDETTKQQSLSDKVIRKYFSKHLPIMATVDDCRNF